MTSNNDDEFWNELYNKFPETFLKDPTEGLDKEDDPNAKPITDFMTPEEAIEFEKRIKELQQ